MRIVSIATLAGLVAFVQAQNGDFIITNSEFDLVPGEEFTLEWAGNDGPVTIRLQTGPSDNLQTVEVLAEGATGDSFTWLVPEDIADNTYNFQIEDEATGEVNYSVQFPLDGDDSAVTATPSAEPTSAEPTVTPSDLTTAAPSTTSEAESSAASSEASEISSAVSSAISSAVSSASESASSSASELASATESDDAAPTESDDVEVPGSKAGRLGSPLALLGLTVAALLYFQ
ncbi:hypothetical protein SODALDRAFT_196418 [Sodiomyces alkalinus F11]|uniref:Yeast cell wall synthesis Kre9/Knh1-like N-terminal domain-containing protein n=1 Tax=Sodiomyces alkalinus (strain CBS 110278 / VKM F-3762 / F11) TaxID=1314773 RepID=A0A3N2PSD2_SODAK|nr:hypothetical protein SODALDRAFT_196418 [Sodiomyces alkalinus F11]ROT37423.1 hypothetical protein SODALDRAFT_196418 [Sodiomyces alkalinus F11]